jgi:hypothetical protein
MSSTIALQRDPAARSAAVSRHRPLARPTRSGALADRIAMHIESLVPQGRAECLDFGSGDLTLAESVEERLLRTHWHCIDVHAAPAAPRTDDHWSQWSRFDGRKVPYADGAFDVALLCDILHRLPEEAPRLLVEAARVAHHVLVKDRFRSGGGGDLYFTQEAFGRLVAEQGLVITALDCGLDPHDDTPVVGNLRRDWPFIAVLRRV